MATTCQHFTIIRLAILPPSPVKSSELTTCPNDLPDEVTPALEDDIPAYERLREQLQTVGFKMALERDEKLGQMTITDGEHRAYLHSQENLLIKGQGVIKKASNGTDELGGGHWFLATPKT